MLETVHIRDYALIERLDVEFRPGFNALTGETGAGKSIVIGALGLALGARASGEAVRAGAEKAVVEVVFRVRQPSRWLLALLEEQDINLEEDMLLIKRVVAADGRSRAQINGASVTIATLAAVGDELVDLHGQHEHQSLLRVERQMELVDAYADALPLAQEVGRCVTEMNALSREIAVLETDDRERARQADFKRFEIQEIDAAGFVPGEEEELRERLHFITHAETIYTLACEVYQGLYESEENAAIDRLDAALRNLDELERIDQRFAELRTQVTEARGCIEGVASELRTYTSRMEFDPAELESLNARLALLGDMKRKYGQDIPAILEYRQQAMATLAEFDSRDETLTALRTKLATLRRETEKKAVELSQKRQDAGRKMDAVATRFLHGLDMPNARFETRLETVPLGVRGIDKVQFMLSANAGEDVKPLRQVASGGEISRVMLALKVAFIHQDDVPTLVFDEIDAGIGGATARRVAEALITLAGAHQVICITHLAQIAAPARAHYVVTKTLGDGHMQTQVNEVSGQARIEEIARLLDGSISAVSLEHAGALLIESETAIQKNRKGKKK